MVDYIQYHNSEAMGYSFFDFSYENGFDISTSRPTSSIVGNRIWLIGGEGKPKKYYLCYHFIADNVVDANKDDYFKYYVNGTSGKVFNPPIEISALPWFEGFLKSVQNFSLGLRKIPIDYLHYFEEIDLKNSGQELVKIQNKPKANGYGNPETNSIVEKAAIDIVTKEYLRLGWKVRSVEAEKCGYDLLCTMGKEERHAEVKGLQGKDIAVILTANEYKCMENDYKFELFIITNVLNGPELNVFSRDKIIKDFSIEPLTYRLRQEKTEL